MKLKTLLLGSAAALVSSSAFAAEPGAPLVAWDPNDYVLACEGGFIINGTDTCLMISGEYTFTLQYQPAGHPHGDFDGDGGALDYGYHMLHEFELNFATLTPVETGNVLSLLTFTNEVSNENGQAGEEFTVSFAWSKDIEEIDDFENADTGGVLRGWITSSAHVSAWGWLGRQTFDQEGEVDHDEIQMIRYFHEFDKFSLGVAVEDSLSSDGLGSIGSEAMPLIFFGGSAWDLGWVDNLDILGVWSDSTNGEVWGGEIDAYWSFGTSDGFIRNGSEFSLAVVSVQNGANLADSDNEGPGQYTMVWGSADLSLGGTAFDLGITGFYRWDPGPTNYFIAVQGEYVINDYWRIAGEWNYELEDARGPYHSAEARFRYRPMGDEIVEFTGAALYEFDDQTLDLDFDLGYNPWDDLLDHNLSIDLEDITEQLGPSEILIEYEVSTAFGP